MNIIEFIPLDLSRHTFSYMESVDLARCSEVSKGWREITMQDSIWQECAKKEGIPSTPNMREYFYSLQPQMLRSNEGIIRSLKGFLDRVSPDENARFRCILGSGADYKMITVMIYNFEVISAGVTIVNGILSPGAALSPTRTEDYFVIKGVEEGWTLEIPSVRNDRMKIGDLKNQEIGLYTDYCQDAVSQNITYTQNSLLHPFHVGLYLANCQFPDANSTCDNNPLLNEINCLIQARLKIMGRERINKKVFDQWIETSKCFVAINTSVLLLSYPLNFFFDFCSSQKKIMGVGSLIMSVTGCYLQHKYLD